MDDSTIAVMFSSDSREWATPADLFRVLDAEFGFTLDVAATPLNAKCLSYITEGENALTMPWSGVCWMNPPYGEAENPCKPNCKKKRCTTRGHIDTYIPGVGDWLRKAQQECGRIDGPEAVVCLLPSRTGTDWFHRYVMPHADDVRFVAGRLTFDGAPSTAPFDSIIVVFRNLFRRRARCTSWDWRPIAEAMRAQQAG